MMMMKTAGIKQIDSLLMCEYILETAGPMSHLKLQKILFYLDAFHLAFFNQPLIEDKFEAWLHGPVSRKIYDALKGQSILFTEVVYKKDPNKEVPSKILPQLMTQDQLELIEEVMENYSKLSAMKLEALTHSEVPWIEARKGYGTADRCTVNISKNLTREYYKEQLYG